MYLRVYLIYSIAILFCVQTSLWAQAKTMPYTVKAGDTFYSIARQHRVSFSTLKQYNIHVNINNIQIGQRLAIPIIRGEKNQRQASIKQNTVLKSSKAKKNRNNKRKRRKKVAVEVVIPPVIVQSTTVKKISEPLGLASKEDKGIAQIVEPEPTFTQPPISLPEKSITEQEVFIKPIPTNQPTTFFTPPNSDEPMPILWEKLIAKDNSNLHIEYDYTPTDITTTARGDFIIAAYKRPFKSTRSFEQCLIKVDAYGNKQWEKNYGQGQTQNVIETQDGNYVLVGGNQVVKLFPDGSIVWTKTLNEYLLNFVVETPDHHLIVASEQKVYCLSAFGKESWSPTHFKNNKYIHAVLATPSNELLFVGREKTKGLSEQIWIAKTNIYGKTEWERVFGHGKLDNANQIIQTQDGHFIITGFSMNSQDFCDTFCPTNVFMMKITTDGQLLWNKEYSNPLYRFNHQQYKAYNTAVDIVELPNQQLVVAANTTYDQTQAWLLVTHPDGRILWEQEYEGIASALTPTQQQQFVLAGWDSYGGASNIWLTQFGGLNAHDATINPYHADVPDPVSTTTRTLPASTSDHQPNPNQSVKNRSVDQDLSFQEPPTPKTNPLPTAPDYVALSTEEQANLHVLAIGTSAPDLQFTAKDAKDFANTFKNQSNQLGVGNKLFSEVSIKKLVGKAANAKSIEAKVEGLHYAFQQGVIQKKDVLLLFLSSHGFIHQEKFRIQGSDYDFRSPKTTSVAYEDLLNYLNKIPCKKVIFIDACQSGPGKATVSTVTEAIRSLGQSTGTITLTSSSSEEQSYENPKVRNGFFTQAIVEALQDGKADANNDQVILLSELTDYVKRAVPNTVGNQIGQRQNPQVIGEGLEGMPIYVVE